MNQTIKKIILLASYSLYFSISTCATYTWVGASGTISSPEDASDLNNWLDYSSSNPPAASDFLSNANIFDFAGAEYVDFGGLTIGNCTFENSTQNTTTYVSLGKLTNKKLKLDYDGTKYPNFTTSAWLKGNIDVDFNSISNTTLEYINTSTGLTQTIMPLSSYQNLAFSGNTKLVNHAVTINGDITDNSNTATLTFAATATPPTFGSNCTFNLTNGTTINFFNFDATTKYFFTDLRTTKSYPGTFTFFKSGGIINGGTFYNVKVSQNVSLGAL